MDSLKQAAPLCISDFLRPCLIVGNRDLKRVKIISHNLFGPQPANGLSLDRSLNTRRAINLRLRLIHTPPRGFNVQHKCFATLLVVNAWLARSCVACPTEVADLLTRQGDEMRPRLFTHSLSISSSSGKADQHNETEIALLCLAQNELT